MWYAISPNSTYKFPLLGLTLQAGEKTIITEDQARILSGYPDIIIFEDKTPSKSADITNESKSWLRNAFTRNTTFSKRTKT